MRKRKDRMEGREDLLAGYPCGVLRCTYEKFPKVLYANAWMFRFWGTTPESEDWQDFFSQNIFFMIPFEERELFRGYLEAAEESETPLVLEHRVVDCAGGHTQLMGWLRIVRDQNGDREYQFLYMQAPDTRVPPQKKREAAYRALLRQSYDMVFELDHEENTMECVYKKESMQLGFISAAKFILSDMVKQSFFNCVHEEDRERVRLSMERVLGPERDEEIENGLTIRFRTLYSFHVWEYEIVIVPLDARATLFCGRDITEKKYAMLRGEELEWMRAMEVCVTAMKNGHTPAGMVFRLAGDLVYPLSSPANVCRFCEISEEEYIRAREIGMPMEEFLRRSHVSRGECWRAIRRGETVLEGEIGESVLERHLYIVKSPVPAGQPEEYTVMFIYIMADNPFAARQDRPRVRINTFGHFDVFVDDQPVVFRNEKSKEMLAILVDRGGGFVANPYLISCLWENEPYNQRLQGRCRQTAHRMMETLKQYGIEDIIEKVDGRRRIIPEKVYCDLFNHKMGVKTPGQLFNGVYMADYSWGEVTLSGLLKEEETSWQGA